MTVHFLIYHFLKLCGHKVFIFFRGALSELAEQQGLKGL